MLDGTDYAQQTIAVNFIDDILITEVMRLVCYNQTIIDDMQLEPDEYAGLALGVKSNAHTTITTRVKPMYDQASILILDNDSECFYSAFGSVYNWFAGPLSMLLICRSYGASGADAFHCGTG